MGLRLHQITAAVLVALCVLTNAAAPEPHVCIIGAGISAASAAHFLSQLPTPPRITVFEKTHRVAGRIRSLHLPQAAPIEAGASIIASANRLMGYFVDVLNLKRSDPPDSSLGLWDGSAFVFRTDEMDIRTKLSMLARYRLSLFRMRALVNNLLAQYDTLYPSEMHVSKLHGYPSVRSLLSRAPELFPWTQEPFPKMVNSRFSRGFIEHLVSAIVRVNYGQEVHQMNALSGSVGLAGSGGGLWAVDGGNEQVVKGLLAKSASTIRLNTTVRSLQRIDSSMDGSGSDGEAGRVRYTLTVSTSRNAPDDPALTPAQQQDDAEDTVTCDAVVLAAPYELSGLSVPPELHKRMHVDRTYHRCVATFVSGVVNASKFGSDHPEDILTVEAANGDGFVSLSPARKFDGPGRVFKVFSRVALTNNDIDRLFEKGAKVVAEFPWLAYPNYRPPEQFADFDVDEGGALIYTAPLESAGSAMEMSAVSGMNAAALVRDRLGLSPGMVNEPEKEDL